jgi:predicted patatin/cPLA2 family phospholipase
VTHPVAAALSERPRDSRIALVVEGGGMRGAGA